MTLLRSIVASTVLLTASLPASAQFGGVYFFQQQISITKSNGGCTLVIIYPEQGPLTFEYKPKGNTLGISYEVKGTAALTGGDQELSLVMNAQDPRPNATESATYNAFGKGSVTVVKDHLSISLAVGDADKLIDFLARAYSISLAYKIGKDGDSEAEHFDLWNLRLVTEKLKMCAASVSPTH